MSTESPPEIDLESDIAIDAEIDPTGSLAEDEVIGADESDEVIGDEPALGQVEAAGETEIAWAREMLEPVADNLGTLLDTRCELTLGEVERHGSRPAGEGSVHISFKLGFKTDIAVLHGCLLIPFADAVSLAGLMMEVPRDELEALRDSETLDSIQKDAMLEIGNMIATSADEALAPLGFDGVSVRSEGCQGVRAGVRPALVYEEGSPLVVGHVELQLGDFPPSKALLILPELSLL